MHIDFSRLTGQTRHGYTLHTLLGVGEVRAVFRATRADDMPGVPCIVDVLRMRPLDTDAYDALQQDIAQRLRLEHLHLVQTWDYRLDELDDEWLWMVIRAEYPGGTLAERLAGQSPLLPLTQTAEILDLVQVVAQAVDYALPQTGDTAFGLSPASIWFDAEGGVYVDGYEVSGLLLRVIQHPPGYRLGGARGDPEYMAPETWKTGVFSASSQQYALAIIAFQLLGGGVPFSAVLPSGLAKQHHSAPVPALTQRRPDLPAATNDVFAQALAKDPADRFPSLLAFAEALTAVLDAVLPDAVLPDAVADDATADPPPVHNATPAQNVPAPEPSAAPVLGRPEDAPDVVHGPPPLPTALPPPSAMAAQTTQRLVLLVSVGMAALLVALVALALVLG